MLPSPDDALLDEVRRRLEELTPTQLDGVARAYGDAVRDEGLHVLRGGQESGDAGGAPTRVAIPPLLTPVLPDRDAAPAAKKLLAGVVQVARALFENRIPTPPGLFNGLTPFEDATIRATWKSAERVASSRVDYLHDAEGRLQALEVNATIPAMQAYSDIAASGWVRFVAPALGAKPEAIPAALAALPSNVDDLRRTLLAVSSENGRPSPKRIGILARANDSQDGELSAIAARFADAGLEPVRVTPDTFWSTKKLDLIYRHLFARRIPAGDRLEMVFADAKGNNLWNPVNGHLEIKGMLALLSTCGADTALAAKAGIDEGILDTVRRVVPWTRLLLAGPSIGPDGSTLTDLPAFVAANPAAVILKRSWDYGGRSVFLVEDFAEGAASTARIEAATGRPLASWEELVTFATTDPTGDWIVQSRVRPKKRMHLRVADGRAEWGELVTDVSAFTAHGGTFSPSGLTARAAGGLVVNIVSGGGMAPILPPYVLRRLLER